MSVCVHMHNSLENRGSLLFKASLEVTCFRHFSHNYSHISETREISVNLLTKSVFRLHVEKPEMLQAFLLSDFFLIADKN